MADTHDSIAGEGGHVHHGPTLPVYLTIAAVLSVFTAVSFIVSWLGYAHSIPGLTIILGVAVCKATLVGAFFMHLKYDWFKLYFLIIPVFVLAVMMMLVL